MASDFNYNFDKNSRELKELIGVEEGGLLDKTVYFRGELTSSNVCKRKGNCTVELLDSPRIEVLGKSKLRVSIVAKVDADIDFGEFGIETDDYACIQFGTHYDLDFGNQLDKLQNPFSTNAVVSPKVVDYGKDATEWMWDEAFEDNITDLDVDNEVSLNEYVWNNVLPSISDTDWKLSVDVLDLNKEVPTLSKESKEELLKNSKLLFKHNQHLSQVFTSRENRNYEVSLNTIGKPSPSSLKIGKDPLIHWVTEFKTIDIEELEVGFVESITGDRFYIVGGAFEIRQQNEIKIQGFSQKGNGVYPSHALCQIYYHLILTKGSLDNHDYVKISLGNQFEFDTEADVRKAQ